MRLRIHDPIIDIADDTYTRGTKDINERRRMGWLLGYTSNTVGKHYLRLTMIQPRDLTEWSWKQDQIATGKKADETRLGIRLHVRQVKQLRNFLDKWIKVHYDGGAK